MITGLKMVVLPVTDWERTRQWYMQVLGFEAVYESPEDNWGEYSTGEGAANLGLWGLPKGYEPIKGDTMTRVAPQPYFQVEDLDKAVDELSMKGVEFEQVFSDDEFKTARFRDPEGHVLYLYQIEGE
jgi:catechol 2,3-dioxygenase-like lactoylglutathione lyase family enzyme